MHCASSTQTFVLQIVTALVYHAKTSSASKLSTGLTALLDI